MRASLWMCVALGCSGKEEPTGGDTLGPCEGGGDPSLQLGTGRQLGFAPFSEGDTIEVSQDPGGTYGLYIDLSTAGLDTTASV